MKIKLLNPKKLLEVEDYLQKIKVFNCIDLDKDIQEEENFKAGCIETLEIILNSLETNSEEETVDLLIQYGFYLQDRYNRDIDIYGKDITFGWIKGSLSIVKWFLED